MKAIVQIASVLIAVALVGCGGDSSATKESVVLPPSPIKAMVEDIAASGELGSGSETLRAELEKLKATDEPKAKALLAELDRIQKMSEPEQIKAAAKKMSEKL